MIGKGVWNGHAKRSSVQEGDGSTFAKRVASVSR